MTSGEMDYGLGVAPDPPARMSEDSLESSTAEEAIVGQPTAMDQDTCRPTCASM